MSDHSASTTPTTLRRQLGARLRALRQERSLTADQVARDLGFSVSKVSRMETGARAVSQDDMVALVAYFDLDQEEAGRLGEIAQAGKRRVRRSVALQPASQESNFAKVKQSGFVELEWDAVRVREFNSGVLPGLLQTESYMRANMRGTAPEVSEATIERAVRMRLDRQRKLATEFEYEVIIDAAVLARTVGGRSAMREQVWRLLSCMREGRVDLRVIPFSSGLHPGLNSQFVSLKLPDASELLDVVFSEGLFGHVSFDTPAEVERFEEIWLHLRSLAESREETAIRLLGSLEQ